MPKIARARPKVTAERVFRALADDTRLRLMRLLGEGEFCVSDMIEILRIPQAKASHHLKYLRRAGLVEARKSGLWSFYRLATPRTAFHEMLLEALTRGSGLIPSASDDAVRTSRVKLTGGCCPGEPCGRPSACRKEKRSLV